MKSKIAAKIIDSTSEDLKMFVRIYADLVVRVNQLLKEKNLTQKDLAEKMDKSPSEISKWLSGNHNLTLRTICKLQAELGAPLLYVPERKEFTTANNGKNIILSVIKNEHIEKKSPTFETVLDVHKELTWAHAS